MQVRFTLKGTSPLLMHNPILVDPEHPIVREIKAITAKRKKTDEDLRQIAKLEWYGGLYTENGTGPERVIQPTSKLRKCLIETARITKQGKQVERALPSFTSVNVPLVYDGPDDIDEVFKQERFHSRLSVGVNGKRIMRVRPQFLPWAMTQDALYVEDAGLNFEDLVRITELAGLATGIGDNRVNGYGRFTGSVEVLA